MAASLTFYQSFETKLGNKEIDLDSDSFKVVLTTSGYTPSASSHTSYTDVTNELATANGYTQNNKTLSSVTWTNVAGVVTWDAADTTWSASGGAITARYAVIFDDTAADKALVCYILLDTTPADVSAPDGTNLTLQWSGSGIFTLSVA